MMMVWDGKSPIVAIKLFFSAPFHLRGYIPKHKKTFRVKGTN